MYIYIYIYICAEVINYSSIHFYPPQTTGFHHRRVTQQGEGQSALHDDLVAHPFSGVPDANHLGTCFFLEISFGIEWGYHILIYKYL